MTTGKIDVSNLREEVGDAALHELMTGIGYISEILRTLPEPVRRYIETELVNGLDQPEQRLPDIAKTLLEALANASSDRTFIPWLLDYIESTHKDSP